MLDSSRWPDELDRVLGAPPGLVAVDMDGTLIKGDIGELLLKERVKSGVELPAVRALLGAQDLWPAYLAAKREIDPYRHYAACALAQQFMTRSDVLSWVAQVFSSGRVEGRPAVLAWVQALVDAGHRVVIVTGSLQWLGEAVAIALKIPVCDVLGQRVVDGGASEGIAIQPPLVCGIGKVERWRQAGLADPLMVVGDTHQDLPLMAIATHLSVAITSPDSLMAADAAAQGAVVFSP